MKKKLLALLGVLMVIGSIFALNTRLFHQDILFYANLEALTKTEISAGYLCMSCENRICVYTYPFPPYVEEVNGYHDYE